MLLTVEQIALSHIVAETGETAGGDNGLGH